MHTKIIRQLVKEWLRIDNEIDMFYSLPIGPICALLVFYALTVAILKLSSRACFILLIALLQVFFNSFLVYGLSRRQRREPTCLVP